MSLSIKLRCFFFFIWNMISIFSVYHTIWAWCISYDTHNTVCMHNSIFFVCSPDKMGAVSFINIYIYDWDNWAQTGSWDAHSHVNTVLQKTGGHVSAAVSLLIISVTLFNWLSVSGPSHTLATKKDDIQVNMKSNCTFLIHFTGVHDSSVYIYIKRKSVYLHNLLSKYNNFPFWLKII